MWEKPDSHGINWTATKLGPSPISQRQPQFVLVGPSRAL
jgi:hypothetical protein